jgi:hypothetical protein
MKVQYGDACLSLQQVYEWTRKFMKSFRSEDRGAAGGAGMAAVQPKEFFSRGMHALPKRWNTCMERNGDYIEK